MTEISATVSQQPAAAAAAKGGPGTNGPAPFGALGFLSLILSNTGQGNATGGIGLVASDGTAAAQGLSGDALQQIPGLQQALQGNAADASAALQALQSNNEIDLSPGGLAGGLLAQLIANLPEGAAPLNLSAAAGVSHQLTGEEILQFDPTQLTIEQLLSGELESITLPNGKEISNEQALLALLLKGRISGQLPEGAKPPQINDDGTPVNLVHPGDIAELAGEIAEQLQQDGGANTQTSPGETLAALLAAAAEGAQPATPATGNAAATPATPAIPTLPQQATGTPGQSGLNGQGAPLNTGQNPGQNNAAQGNTGQNNTAQNTTAANTAQAPDITGDDAPRPDYEWRASQSSGNDGRPASPGASGRDNALQSLMSALNRTQNTRMNASIGLQQAMQAVQSAPQGVVAAADAAGGNAGEFDFNNGGRGPFADADGLIEEMLTQHHTQNGRGSEARPSQSFTNLLTTARSATSGHPATQTVAFQMSRMSSSGMDRITLRLDPPELGRVEVRMEFGDDGKVRAHLIADRPDTLDTLQRDARALERALQDAGLETDEGSLTFDLRQGDDNNGQDPQDGRSRNAYSGMDGAEGEDDGEITTHVDVMPGGMAGHMKLDLLV